MAGRRPTWARTSRPKTSPGYVADNDVALVALSASDPARLGALGAAISAVRDADRGRGIRVLLGGRITEHGGPAIDPAPDWAGTSLVEATAYATSIGNGGG